MPAGVMLNGAHPAGGLAAAPRDGPMTPQATAYSPDSHSFLHESAIGASLMKISVSPFESEHETSALAELHGTIAASPWLRLGARLH